MDELIRAIRTTPIIDNHAHPLLVPSALAQHPFISITSEANGAALNTVPSSLAHIRAVNQLSKILGCPATWHDVVAAIETERQKPNDAWMKRCLEGIETILIDDGLDGRDEVYDYAWHSRMTKEKCKRIVRIEKIAEEIINRSLKQPDTSPSDMFLDVIRQFDRTIDEAILDPEVAGFKSVICYRTGLDIPQSSPSLNDVNSSFLEVISTHRAEGNSQFKRLDGTLLNAFLVHRTATAIQNSLAQHKKPFQFHTGLGDNDITLTRSSPSHLQNFIRNYPQVPIVLLHASYPWTKEAGYLATVYDNVYADIGEIFPFLSREGQETALRDVLQLCPSEKILWSTDAHRFPERYLLAVVQVREALESVLTEYVRRGDLVIHQAIKIVQDILFNTSNVLYNLDLKLSSLPLISMSSLTPHTSDLNLLLLFLDKHPSTKLLRLCYLDYTATPRMRVVPVQRAISVLQSEGSLNIGITEACLGLLQNDTIISGVTATGEYKLRGIFSSIRPGPSESYASIQCEFLEQNCSELAMCPRSILRRTIQGAKSHGLEFVLGFEIEVVFLSRTQGSESRYVANAFSAGHAWNSARALQRKALLSVVDEIYGSLSDAGIHLETFHAESSTGQYEFVLPALPPLEAVDTLFHAREVICTIADRHALRATLYPKPFPMEAGTASHVHISISSPTGVEKGVYESFYAGVLGHIRAILAFTYSNPASYARMADSCWAGGRWVAWGTQNRETALRKISGSHWEVKVLDGLANMYLAMAAIIAAGTNGVLHHERLTWQDCSGDPAMLSNEERKHLGIEEGLPTGLSEALEALKRDEALIRILGREAVERYVAVKTAEVALLGNMKGREREQWLIERY